MPTQWLTLTSIAGPTGTFVQEHFNNWRDTNDQGAIDSFCLLLFEHRKELPIIYWTEWIDRWLMADMVPLKEWIDGKRFEVWCVPSKKALKWAKRIPKQFDEQVWLATRLQEASMAWQGLFKSTTVILIRETLGGCSTDEEVVAAAAPVADWV